MSFEQKPSYITTYNDPIVYYSVYSVFKYLIDRHYSIFDILHEVQGHKAEKTKTE